MKYTKIRIFTSEEFIPIAEALLSEQGFEAFVETEEGAETGILSDDFDKESFEKALNILSEEQKLTWEISEEPLKNWNEEWEKSYEPMTIGKRCIVRAEFHPEAPEYDYQILITPRMSFGTGHHHTTKLVMEFLLDDELSGKEVLDLGTGTGILGILALKKGAVLLDACDTEPWTVDNANENAKLNNVSFEAKEGTVKQMPERKYDLVLANINRNVLLSEMGEYADRTKPGGRVILSGFHDKDCELIEASARKFGLKTLSRKQSAEWVSLKMGFEQ